MILVVGRVRSPAEKRDALVALMEKMRDKSRREKGCIRYGFFAAVEDPLGFIAVEEWADREPWTVISPSRTCSSSPQGCWSWCLNGPRWRSTRWRKRPRSQEPRRPRSGSGNHPLTPPHSKPPGCGSSALDEKQRCVFASRSPVTSPAERFTAPKPVEGRRRNRIGKPQSAAALRCRPARCRFRIPLAVPLEALHLWGFFRVVGHSPPSPIERRNRCSRCGHTHGRQRAHSRRERRWWWRAAYNYSAGSGPGSG